MAKTFLSLSDHHNLNSLHFLQCCFVLSLVLVQQLLHPLDFRTQFDVCAGAENEATLTLGQLIQTLTWDSHLAVLQLGNCNFVLDVKFLNPLIIGLRLSNQAHSDFEAFGAVSQTVENFLWREVGSGSGG